MKLVIVESPAKAATIEKFLPRDYKVVASYGHVRDLPSSASEIPAKYKGFAWSRLAVDVENGYEPIYVVSKESRKRIAELKKLVKEADEVILATDEDREGESISWHLVQALEPKAPVKRIAFHEITKQAILDALEHPREVDQQLVNAQESRRILDRLFGYELSPLLWRKVRPKLSAGRVQSVAVRLVVEREEERKRFVVAEYWDIEAALEADGIKFNATLSSLDGKRIASGKDFDASNGQLTAELDAKTGKAKAGDVVWLKTADARSVAESVAKSTPWRVVGVEQKETKLRPDPPFITSSLQRAASGLLGFSPRRTMQLAQQLYEGVDLGGGEREGLITYMRTDSVALSQEALREAETVITSAYGEKYHKRRQFTTKSKLAQEAHEAIRPTHLHRRPEQVSAYLDDGQLKLYRLIWNRTMACQMADAELLRTAIEIEAKAGGRSAVFRANGSVVTFPGFLKVSDSAQRDTELPRVESGWGVGAGEKIALENVEPARHETRPPARYTEASLIQRLEEEGIGRPSTYAPTISTIQQRGYVELLGKALVPTFLGIAVTLLLKEHFGEYVDPGFTARMEDALDAIAQGQQERGKFLDEFYKGGGEFGRGLKPAIEQNEKEIDYPRILLGSDPQTGEKLVVRIGRTAPFIQRGEGGTDNTATVPNDMLFEDLTPERAVTLLREKAKGNEAIGLDPVTGQKIYALIGPYGPYVQLGEVSDDNKRPKRASIPKDKPVGEVDLSLALRLLSLPRELGNHPEKGEAVSATIGRFGPFVKCGDDFRSIPKDEDVYAITLERALELIAAPKQSRRTTKTVLRELGTDPTTKTTVELCEGKYGPYVTNGAANASLPKNGKVEDFTLEAALQLLADAPARKSKAKPRAKTSTRRKSAAK